MGEVPGEAQAITTPAARRPVIVAEITCLMGTETSTQ